MKKILFFVLLISINVNAFSEPVTPPSAYKVPKDLFESELDFYKREIGKSGTVITFSLIGLVSSFVMASTFQTLKSSEIMDAKIADPLIITSYCLVGASSASSVYGFFKWKKNSEIYMDTLRLKNQYYNLVQ